MSEEVYPYKRISSHEYLFTSIGRKGAVKKLVSFEELEPGIFNVLLQDEVDDERLGDTAITNNGDALKVINTTAAIIRDFLDGSSVVAVHLAGSTQQRSNIYHRRILRELENVIVLGKAAGGASFEPVESDKVYVAFLVLPK